MQVLYNRGWEATPRALHTPKGVLGACAGSYFLMQAQLRFSCGRRNFWRHALGVDQARGSHPYKWAGIPRSRQQTLAASRVLNIEKRRGGSHGATIVNCFGLLPRAWRKRIVPTLWHMRCATHYMNTRRTHPWHRYEVVLWEAERARVYRGRQQHNALYISFT